MHSRVAKMKIKATEIIKIIFIICIVKEMCSWNPWMSPGLHSPQFQYQGLVVFLLHLFVLCDGTGSSAAVRLPLFKLRPLFASSIQDCSLHAYALLVCLMNVKSLPILLYWKFSWTIFKQTSVGFYITHTVRVLAVSISTNKCTWQNTIHDKYQTPTCFGSGVQYSACLLEQRNSSLTR
jgi:hypothetical protein